MSNQKLIFPYIPCPCGSSKKAKFCCLKSNKWSRKPAGIVTSREQDYKNLKCYAKILGNCSRTISREHFISEAVLKHLEIDGGIEAFGFRFLGSQSKSISLKGMASKILCESHNNSLSPLDFEAGRLFKSAFEVALNYQQASQLNIFTGEDVELWLLKTLLGILNSDQIQVNSYSGLSKSNYSFDTDLVKILFQQKEWPRRWGLYLVIGALPCDGHFLFCPNVENDKVTGAHIRFCGHQFFLNCGAEKVVSPWFDFPRVPKSLSKLYRPHLINHYREDSFHQLILTWQDYGKKFIDLRHGQAKFYHHEEIPSPGIQPLFELMEDPRSALNKYYNPSK